MDIHEFITATSPEIDIICGTAPDPLTPRAQVMEVILATDDHHYAVLYADGRGGNHRLLPSLVQQASEAQLTCREQILDFDARGVIVGIQDT
jgi:hypothetical protein